MINDWEGSKMKHRAVVSNFLFRWNKSTNQQLVALFKRSTHPDIHSYQGKYAPIAGSIEDSDPNARAAAEREIKEETQLVPHRDITFAFAGPSFSFEDEKSQRSWTVYPFGWDLEVSDDVIKVDWEHSGWSWFDPQNVLDQTMVDQYVPNLHKSLQRVYFGPNGMFCTSGGLISRDNPSGGIFLDTIRGLRNNAKDGARVLATDALKGLLRIVEYLCKTSTHESQREAAWHALRVAAFHFIYSARPSMNSAISAALLGALHAIARHSGGGHVEMQTMQDLLEKMVAEREAATSKIANAFASYLYRQLGKHASPDESSAAQPTSPTCDIITISSSSTIAASVKHIITGKILPTNSALNLTIFESRPSCEGASFAASILESIDLPQLSTQIPRVSVKVAPESHMNIVLQGHSGASNPSLRIILLGADRITSAGHVINKAGSAQLAALAQLTSTSNSKVVVLSEQDKIAVPDPGSLPHYSRYLEHSTAGSLQAHHEIEFEKSKQSELNRIHYERHDAKEVYKAWSEDTQKTMQKYLNTTTASHNGQTVQVEIENIYFEAVNEAHVDVYLTENGEMTRQQILRISVNRAKIEEELFGDLYD